MDDDGRMRARAGFVQPGRDYLAGDEHDHRPHVGREHAADGAGVMAADLLRTDLHSTQ